MKYIMSMSQNRRARNNVIIFTSIVIYYALVSVGLPSSFVLNMIMIVLIFWLLVYIAYNPIMFIVNNIFEIFKERKIKKAVRSTLNIDELSWSEFEYYVAEKLKQQGYTGVRLTEHYDLGVDIIAKKNDITWGVQVKHYKNLVGVDAVRQVVSALNKYKCDRAIVVTNNFYTWPAQEIARSNNCILIDRITLAKWDSK